MNNEKHDLNSLPVVQTLQLIIDGTVTGDEAAGILRDAVSAQHLAEGIICARRDLITRAEEMLAYGKKGKPTSGSFRFADISSISSSVKFAAPASPHYATPQ